MHRRAVTFATAGVLVFLLALGGALLPVPYVALLPGPTKNVLGQADGEALISIDGRETYATDGRLNLVTVQYRGGPGYRLDLFTALRGWVDPQVAVVPEQAVFPEGQTADEVRQNTSRRMRQSQQDAAVAAVRELGIPVDATVRVSRVMKEFPARGVLREGDVVVAVDGETIAGPAAVANRVSGHQPGDTVSFTVKRDGGEKRVRVDTVGNPDNPDEAMVGVYMRTNYDYPLDVQIRIDEIGGPSAGLMFALGVADKLTEGDLTGGELIAGTGTITPDGKVGAIGGIQQKLAGARSDGAEVFLTPAGNCAKARGAKPPELTLVKVKTLDGALTSLRNLRSGQGNVPHC